MDAASPATSMPSVASRGMARYPPSGIRWAEYSFSSAPRRYGAIAGCALTPAMSSSGRILASARPVRPTTTPTLTVSRLV